VKLLRLLPLAAAALVALTGCRTEGEARPAPVAAAKPDLPVELKETLAEVAPPAARAPTGAGERVLVETGELVSPVRSEVAMRLPGRVGRVFVDAGVRVTKDQPLLELETEYLALEVQRAEAALARARAAAEEAKRDHERKQQLAGKGSVSAAVHERTRALREQAEASRAEAEAALALARQRLKDATLLSPIEGVVAERLADPGERLGEATVAFVVMQVAPLKLRFRVPERHLAAVKAGQTVRARVDPYPDRVFTGRVSMVVRTVDPATRSFLVEAEIPNRDGRLEPGLFARVELELEK
jgi:RND family efflux transporter MFP subunit